MRHDAGADQPPGQIVPFHCGGNYSFKPPCPFDLALIKPGLPPPHVAAESSWVPPRVGCPIHGFHVLIQPCLPYDSPGAGMSGAGSVRSLSPSTTAFPTTLLGPHIQHATKAEPAELGIKREAPGGN